MSKIKIKSTISTYPSQVRKSMSSSDGQQDGQNGIIMYIRKKGTQHNMNTPIMKPSVRAARRSLDNDIRCFSSINCDTLFGLRIDGFFGSLPLIGMHMNVVFTFAVPGTSLADATIALALSDETSCRSVTESSCIIGCKNWFAWLVSASSLAAAIEVVAAAALARLRFSRFCPFSWCLACALESVSFGCSLWFVSLLTDSWSCCVVNGSLPQALFNWFKFDWRARFCRRRLVAM